MQANRIQVAQRAIIMQLLRDDHPLCWTRAELEAQMQDVEQQTIVDAVAILGLEQALFFNERAIWVSRCARHLDTLGLLSI